MENNAYNHENEIELLRKLRNLSKRAFYNVCVDEGCNIPEGEKTEPDSQTDLFENSVFNLFVKAVRDGISLEKSLIC